MIDGIDLATASLASLRQQIGLVTQQTITFHESIGANIAYGCPDATSGQIIEAAKRAYAHEFIEQTPKGYDTIVGELGVTLSGGQLQRIAIARAILRDPAILIFDEATSQIDADSEAKIQKAIAEFSQGRTSFIIAHRLSTIIDADRIIVLDAGRLAADGTHKELLESCTLYRPAVWKRKLTDNTVMESSSDLHSTIRTVRGRLSADALLAGVWAGIPAGDPVTPDQRKHAMEKQSRLDAIAQRIAKCNACGLHATVTHVVPGEGNPDAPDRVCRRGARGH